MSELVCNCNVKFSKLSIFLSLLVNNFNTGSKVRGINALSPNWFIITLSPNWFIITER